MNKKALLDYALFARKELETQIALSLNKLGIYKDKILKANVVGDYTIIEGNPDSYPKRVYSLRKMMISEYFEGEEKFETVVEEFAYTWFNRLVAIRFMEVHDYFPHGFHVLTSRDGSYEPEILSNLPYVLSELNLEEEVIRSLRDQNKIEELYRYVLVKQCSALSKIVPDIFDVREPYLELLLPNNLLSRDSVIRKIELIPEEDFMNDIEVIGWLYQFYNSIKKDEVYASKERVDKDTIAAVTQLFTPDWIVRYMADNSVGRLWLESYPNSPLKQSLKYYVEDAEQDETAQKKLDEIKYKNVNPEEIKIIEPCCGSGHILVYVFDLLLSMYLEQGYNKRDIPALILKNNLYGLDVDKRAAQLAKFSLVMKARSIDNRFFNEDRFVNPRVFEIKDSQLLIALNYKDAMKSLHFTEESIKLAEYLVNTFEYGKVIGSLLKVVSKDYTPLVDDIKRCKEIESPGIFEQDFYDKGLKRLRYLARVARVLARKYDIAITNPPYLSENIMELNCKQYLVDYYFIARHDLYTAFIIQNKNFCKPNGIIAMVTQHYFMYLQSFKELREGFKFRFLSLIDLGPRAFPEISGDVVQTATYVFRNTKHDINAKFFDLRSINNSSEKETHFLNNKTKYWTKKEDEFSIYKDTVYAFNSSSKLDEIVKQKKYLSEFFVSKAGVCTGNDPYFVRFWFEPEYAIGFKDDKMIFPKYANFSKGGSGKYYSGNIDYVIKLNDLYDDKLTNKSVRRGDSAYYFKKGISWSQMGGGLNKRFYQIEDCVCGTSSPSIYPKAKTPDGMLFYVLEFLNSDVSKNILRILSPTTLSVLSTDVAYLPLVYSNEQATRIINISKRNIEIAKLGLRLGEENKEFTFGAFRYGHPRISDDYDELKDVNKLLQDELVTNHETINSIFSRIYDVEVTESFDYDIESIIPLFSTKQYAKSVISYFVGCLMGRYSLEQEGLVYAGGQFVRSKFADYVDDDGILPVYQFIGINDGLTQSICKLVKRVYGDTYYRENLDFIADALGRKTEEGAEEAINRYLNDDFYKDHLKVYQNRPIYWMFSSGKVGAFKCLVYLHRYDKNTLAKINAKYFLPRTAMYKAEGERLADQFKRADIAQKKKIDNQLKQIEAAQEELQIYGQVLDHMANQFIDIDLDDGVKVNYVKFQGVSIVVNGATVKKDLLVPFGLEKVKK